MEVVGTVLSVTRTLESALKQCAELKAILSKYGYESKIKELEKTINIINSVFRDAEKKQELSNVAQQLIEDLKDVVFDADDLFDKFVTMAEQKKHVKADGTISNKAWHLLSRLNPLVAVKMSKEVEKIKKKLDALAYNRQFTMEFNHEPIKYRLPETSSSVNVKDIIGRKRDLKRIVRKLLDSDVQTKVSFLSIVGMGGLGKTALAQLVHNDDDVKKAFSVRLWVCVSDQDQEQLDIVGILRKILASITGKNHEGSCKQTIESQLQQQLFHKRYFLVLDDVWTENRSQWNQLVDSLKVGNRRSWIVVTTRSEVTAEIIGCGNDLMYKLQGLSKPKAWSLFKREAFGSQHSSGQDEFVEIGKKIVEACAGVPLALRVAGSLVFGQDKKKWQSVQEVGVASSDITQILKLSYHHLPSSIKSCFSYCALFPKDYRMKKDMLMSLWRAQNYVHPLHKDQSIEDACEEHFLILLRRCFFQDIEKDDETDEIISIKIHDLMHDIAQNASAKEICATTTFSDKLNEKVRHLSVSSNPSCGKNNIGKTRVRSYLNFFESGHHESGKGDKFVKAIIKSCGYLRALKLVGLEEKCFSSSIDKLLHLRYLDLSENKNLEVLPESTTKLWNLETLILADCKNLRELPKNLGKLVKLRELNISCCYSLRYMPKGMDKLTCLNRLSDFIVGSERSSSWTECLSSLEELKALSNLKDKCCIEIRWPENVKDISQKAREREGLYLANKNLSSIVFYFNVAESDRETYEEELLKLMEDLHPSTSLRFLNVYGYPITKLPEWISLLPNLVNLEISNSENLEYLESFGNVKEGSFLPSLQKLTFLELPKLKGWRRGAKDVEGLPCLKEVTVEDCPELTCIPLGPKLETLFLMKFNTSLRGIIETKRNDSSGEVVFECPILKDVTIDSVTWLNSLPIDAFRCLESLCILSDEEVESLKEVEGVLRACSYSLRSLEIETSHNLTSIVTGGLEHLHTLENLRILCCVNLNLLEEEKEEDCAGVDFGSMTSQFILPCLRTMVLADLDDMECLPDWMQFLPNLETLELIRCHGLKAMPHWMPKLTSRKLCNVVVR